MFEKLKALFGIGQHESQVEGRVPGVDKPIVEEARNKPNVENEAAASNIHPMDEHRKAEANKHPESPAGAISGDTDPAGRGAMLAGDENSREKLAEKEMEESIKRHEKDR